MNEWLSSRASACEPGAHTPQFIDRTRRMGPHLRGDDSRRRRNYLNFGRACFIRPIVAHGSLRPDRRCITFFTVYWFALLSELNSDQSIGTETGAPGRARVE